MDAFAARLAKHTRVQLLQVTQNSTDGSRLHVFTAYDARSQIIDGHEMISKLEGFATSNGYILMSGSEIASRHAACTGTPSVATTLAAAVTPTATTTTTTTTTSTNATTTTTATVTTVDPCNVVKCALQCESECGWSRPLMLCVSGLDTTQSEIDERLGDCPAKTTSTLTTTTVTTVTTTTVDPCNVVKCALQCESECGWSRPLMQCVSGLDTTQSEIAERLGDCPPPPATPPSTTAATAAECNAGMRMFELPVLEAKGRQLAGKGLLSERNPGGSLDACSAACLGESGCPGFAYSADKQCTLYNAVGFASLAANKTFTVGWSAYRRRATCRDDAAVSTRVPTTTAGGGAAPSETNASSPVCNSMEQFATGEPGFQDGDQIKQTSATAVAECAIECLSVDTCVAFNFFASQKRCSLKSKTKSTLKLATDVAGKLWHSKYTYYERIMSGCPGGVEVVTTSPSASVTSATTGTGTGTGNSIFMGCPDGVFAAFAEPRAKTKGRYAKGDGFISDVAIPDLKTCADLCFADALCQGFSHSSSGVGKTCALYNQVGVASPDTLPHGTDFVADFSTYLRLASCRSLVSTAAATADVTTAAPAVVTATTHATTAPSTSTIGDSAPPTTATGQSPVATTALLCSGGTLAMFKLPLANTKGRYIKGAGVLKGILTADLSACAQACVADVLCRGFAHTVKGNVDFECQLYTESGVEGSLPINTAFSVGYDFYARLDSCRQ